MNPQDPLQPTNQPQTPVQPNAPQQPQVLPQEPMPPKQASVQQPVMQQPYVQPNIPSPQPTNAVKSGPNIKLIAIIAVGAILLLGGLFLAYNAFSGDSKSNSSLLSEPKEISKDTKVGEEVNLDGLKINISAVDQKTSLGEYYDPAPGHVFVVATVRTENTTDHNVSVSPYDFKYLTTNGQFIDGSDLYNSSEKLPTGEIAPGGTAQGLVKFEVPTAQIGPGVKINYESVYLPTDYTKAQITYKTSVVLQ